MSISRRLLALLLAVTAFLGLAQVSARAADFAPCPNDQFRTGYGALLPDCRAYEQVTPVDKNGNNVGPSVDLVQAAPQGDAITVFSVGGIPGGTGAQDFPLFIARRGSDQWSTQGLFPSATFGPAAGVIGWNPDLEAAFVFARQFGGGPALFLRDSSDGSLETIVPYAAGVKEYFFAGASLGSSEVLLETSGTAQLLPGAAAGKSNVYLWDRETGDLHLAGALNDGSAPPEGALAGPYDWFNKNPEKTEQGGSALRYYTQDANAISDDGSMVFFTAAGEAQIYLRENPTRPQSPLDGGGACTEPALACTVRISASQKTNGSGPGGTDPSGPLPAAFAGATPDGAEAFFTSSEELTNDATTSPPPPSIGRASLAGNGVDQSFIPVTADGLAVDGSNVYWADPSTNSIGRANLDGTGVEEEFITGADVPSGVTVDSTHIYWTNTGTGANGAGTIGRANLDGTEVNQAFIVGANNPQGIDVDATHIYWGNAGSTAATRRIGRANIDGTEVNQAFISVASALNPGGIAVDETHIYWSRPNGEAIGRAKLDGTEVNQAFIAGADEPLGLALDGTHIYWADPQANGVGRAKLDGTEVDTSFVAVPGGKNPLGIAVSAAHIYFSRPNVADPGNDLYRYDVGSGNLTDITADGGANLSGADVLGILGISDDGSHIYFAANGVLAPGATLGDCHNGDQGGGASGVCNLYLWHDGVTTFIARLSNQGVSRGDVENWSPKTSPKFDERTARISPNGETLLFRSQLALTSYESEGVPQFYRYDAEADELLCVSCNPEGDPPVGMPRLQNEFELIGSVEARAAILTRNLSDSGARVFFETPDALVAGDTNGVTDVYEWEAEGAGSCSGQAQNGGCLYLLSTGRGPEPSLFADASANGDDAFFFTSEPLVEQDGDGGVVDIYAARVGGGLAAQHQQPPSPCFGDACKGQPSAPPSAQVPGSAAFAGSGNVKRGACRKGKVRRRGRCVSRRKASRRACRKARQKAPSRCIRRADDDRRAAR